MGHEVQILPTMQFLNASLGSVNNSITIQVGDSLSEDCESYSAQLIQHAGFCSIPPKPVAGKPSTEYTVVKTSFFDYAIASRDVASQVNYGNLGYGETTIYAAGETGSAQGRVMLKGGGTVALYTTDTNDSSGNGVYLQVSPTALQFVSPWGKLIFDASGFHVSTITGARLDLGSLSPPGLGALIGSYARITAGTCTVDSGAIMLGPSAGAYLQAAYSIAPLEPGVQIPAAPPVTAAGASSSVYIGIGP